MGDMRASHAFYKLLVPDTRVASSETARLAFPFEEAEDVTLANRALYVADDGSRRVIQELHTHLDRGFTTGLETNTSGD